MNKQIEKELRAKALLGESVLVDPKELLGIMKAEYTSRLELVNQKIAYEELLDKNDVLHNKLSDRMIDIKKMAREITSLREEVSKLHTVERSNKEMRKAIAIYQHMSRNTKIDLGGYHEEV